MLRWIIILALVCSISAIVGLGLIVPVQGSVQGLLLALTALSATMLVSSFDAFETQASTAERDDEG